MPHKVASFFDPHSILPSFIYEPKKLSIHRTPEEKVDFGSRLSISSQSSQESNEHTAKMPDSQFKRLSQHLKASATKTPTKTPASHHIPANLKITMESPPVVLFGQPVISSGALLSGQLKLYVTDSSMVIKDFKMKFFVERTIKRPFKHNCKDCSVQKTELVSWNFLQENAKVPKGEQVYPFSYLLKGDMPASMDGPLSSIAYMFHAVLVSASGEKTELKYELPVKRAIAAGEGPRHSIRIFPPTSLTCHVDLPPALYPIGEEKALLKLEGLIRREEDAKVQHQWRLKRMSWRLDESHVAKSEACEKHVSKLRESAKQGEEPTIYYKNREVRTIGSGDMRSGWKNDYLSDTGSVMFEFPFSVNHHYVPTCDLHDGNDEETNMEVKHQLIVELVIAEEQAPTKKPEHSTPTGAARILRMQFNIVLTQRTGMGIAWDEEQPPVYENVPASPPGYRYADMQDYQGTPFASSSLPEPPEYVELEQLGGHE